MLVCSFFAHQVVVIWLIATNNYRNSAPPFFLILTAVVIGVCFVNRSCLLASGHPRARVQLKTPDSGGSIFGGLVICQSICWRGLFDCGVCTQRITSLKNQHYSVFQSFDSWGRESRQGELWTYFMPLQSHCTSESVFSVLRKSYLRTYVYVRIDRLYRLNAITR